MDNIMFSDEQWKAYELTQYNGRSLNQAANEMGVSRPHIVKLLADMKAEEPVLFVSDTDRTALGRTVGGKDRQKMLSYRPFMDESKIGQDKGGIKQKW